MSRPCTLLLTDFYKLCHMNMYDKRVVRMTSYLTPRGSRFPEQEWILMFGLQMFVHKYLLKDFDNNFFTLPWEEIEEQYKTVLEKSLLYSEREYSQTLEKVKALHDLGYLPIKVRGLPEGKKVPVGVPCVEISVTDDRFAWVGQAVECLLSCSIWHPMVSATVGYRYRELAHDFAVKSSDKSDGTMSMCDFSLRGQESIESAIASSVGWLASMKNSSTVPARALIEECYPATDKDALQVYGLTSTEHSVMTTDFAINGDERETYRRLLTEVYPNTSFAAVCDSYDYWNVLTNILPSLKDEVNAHNGFIGVRHDSADPVEALCGIPQISVNLLPDEGFVRGCVRVITESHKFEAYSHEKFGQEFTVYAVEYINGEQSQSRLVTGKFVLDHVDDVIYKVTSVENRERTWEEKGMVESIYDLFGGTVNSKGYKVANPHVKAVYGDSITLGRAKEIFERLDAKKFSIDNISLGVGSFSMEAVEWDGKLYPFTRDTFSIAIKCTWAQLEDGTRIPVYKDPKGFTGKKSQKGLCLVTEDPEKGYVFTDGHLDPEPLEADPHNAMITYFVDGSEAEGPQRDFAYVRENINQYFKD